METSAANRVFRIPELLQLIVLELNSARDLARMARVAHASHLPSIQTLWSGNSPLLYLRGRLLSHLMQLLPKELMQKEHAECNWSFSRSPFASEWSRVRHYSIHTKALEITRSDYSLDIFSYFNDAKPNLFPQLRKIELHDNIALSAAGWTMLAVPTLKDLKLCDHSSPARTTLDDLASFCQQLPQRTPQLRRLHLPCTKTHGVVSKEGERAPNILAALRSLTDLTELSWTWDCQLSNTVVMFLATQLRLTKVSLGRLEQPVGKLGAKGTLFPCLTDLQLIGMDVGMESVLKQLPSLESLTRIALRYTQLHLTPKLLALSPLCQASGLTNILLEFRPYNLPWPDLEFGSLSPILSCKKITKFSLSSIPRVEGLDDDAMCMMAESWPELEDIFIFTGEFANEDDSSLRPSLFGLSSLADLCPRLRRVTMTVIFACCLYYDLMDDEEGTRHHETRTLELLELRYSRWEDNLDCKHHIHPQATAKILREIWPALKAKDVHVMPRPVRQDERLLFERQQQVKQCLAHMEQKQEIGQRDSVISSLRKQKSELEAECARLRRELAGAKGGFAPRG